MINKLLAQSPYQKMVISGPGRIRTCDQAIMSRLR
jgi:hypothetical protein